MIAASWELVRRRSVIRVIDLRNRGVSSRGRCPQAYRSEWPLEGVARPVVTLTFLITGPCFRQVHLSVLCEPSPPAET